MKLKEKVLKFLEENRGVHVSGEQIAEALDVTRTAIWKNINQLKLEGYNIEAVTNKGYTILESNDIVNEPGIRKFIDKTTPFEFAVYDSVLSTNTLIREETHRKEGYVIIANNQTGGRGRFGREFFSPKNTGVYFSLLLKPNLISSQAFVITAMAAVAVCRAIKKATGKQAGIKWVNDVYLNGKKVCGILTQGSFSLENNIAEYVVVGIGINVYEPLESFPKELKSKAGFIEEKSKGNLKNKLIGEVLNEFWKLYKDTDFEAVIKEYKEYNFVIGRDVYVLKNDTKIPAKAIDMDKLGNLVVRYEDGLVESLCYGEISIRL